jgi:ABC-type multidrug transport system fused ATPase/permease subunit
MNGLIMFIPGYLLWHYTRAIKDFFKVSGNFIWFFYHFFSIPVLFGTLVTPFRRMEEKYKKELNIEAFFEALIVNIIMRIIGALSRATVILVGIIAILLTIVSSVALFIVWLLLPLLVPTFFLLGIVGINI